MEFELGFVCFYNTFTIVQAPGDIGAGFKFCV